MDTLLTSWRDNSSTGSTDDASWHQYLSYVDSLGSFGGECWLTVHASLYWLRSETALSLIDVRRGWAKMVTSRNKFMQHIRKCLAPSPARIRPLVLPLTTIPTMIGPYIFPMLPKWNALNLHLISSLSLHDAQNLLAQLVREYFQILVPHAIPFRHHNKIIHSHQKR